MTLPFNLNPIRLDQAIRLSGIPIAGVTTLGPGPFASGNVRIDFLNATPAQVSGAHEILTAFDFSPAAVSGYMQQKAVEDAQVDYDVGRPGSRIDRALAATLVDELNIIRRQVITVGSFAWDPANLADGAGLTRADIAVSGVEFRDVVIVTAPYSLQGILTQAYVHGSGTLGVRLQNETGGAINLANGNWGYVVWRPENMNPRTNAQARNTILDKISGNI